MDNNTRKNKRDLERKKNALKEWWFCLAAFRNGKFLKIILKIPRISLGKW